MALQVQDSSLEIIKLSLVCAKLKEQRGDQMECILISARVPSEEKLDFLWAAI